MRWSRLCGFVALLWLGASAALARETVHITFRCWDGDEAQKALKPAVADFEKKYPYIKVKFESVTQSYMEKLLADFAAKKAPDIAMMDPGGFQKFAKRNALLPLNQFFDVVPDFDIDSYYKNLVDAHSYRGTLYVLPRDIAPIGIVYYNKKMFDEAGLSYPDGSWTWDFQERPELREKDFLWVMHQLTGRNARGQKVWGYAPGWPDLFVEQFFLSTGGKFVDDPEEPTKLYFDDPRLIRAFELLQNLSLKKQWIPSQTQLSTVLQASAGQLFTQQRCAMYQSGIWDVPNFRRDLVPGTPGFFEWDIALAPAYKDGTLRTSTGGSGYAIMSTTQHPKEAWLLTQWMAGPPGMLAMAKAGLAQPGIRKMALEPPWIPDENIPLAQRYPPSRIVTDQAARHVVFTPTSEYYAQVRNYVTSEWGPLWSGDDTPKAALTRGNERAQARLDLLRRENRQMKPFNWPLGWLFGGLLTAAAIFWVYWPERGRRLSKAQKKENWVAYLFLSPWVLGIMIFTLGPMILSLMMSFADWDIVMPAKWRGLGNYSEMIHFDPRFFVSLRVTFVYTLFAVPLGLAISLAMALLLNVRVYGMPLFRTCFYLPSLASGVAAALIWRRIFQPEGGLLNAFLYSPIGRTLGIPAFLSPFSPNQDQVNWLGNERTSLAALILMSLWGAGGGMVILLAGLQGIPQHYYEAATVDGASAWRRFRAVTLPMLSPALLFVTITGVIGSFQVFTQAFVMTGGGPGDSTRFFMLHLYDQGLLSLRMGYASALAWVLFVVILIFTLVQLKLSRAMIYYEAN